MKIVITKGGSHEDWPNVAVENITFFGTPSSGNSLKLWHEHFGHLHPEMILKISRENMVTDMKLSDKFKRKQNCVKVVCTGKVINFFTQKVTKHPDQRKQENYFILMFVVP
jgi:hypothetical protein